MLKYAILIVIIVIGYVAYTGEDVTEEYDAISEIRTIAWNEVIDPFAKDVLKKASESNLYDAIKDSIQNYGDNKIEM